MPKSNITCHLRDAVRMPCEGGFCLVGKIFDDTKGRFKDGDTVRTGRVVHIDLHSPIFTTKNGIYQVDNWNIGHDGKQLGLSS